MGDIFYNGGDKMNLIARRLRGMQDIIPGEIEKWEYIEKIMKKQAELYGFKLIRTPAVEATGLFKREASEATDIVEKEMYVFNDKGSRSVSLRPEGTAGVIRAVLENGMHNQVLPLKLIYISSCYRYEKPQSGRFREFYQFGAEIIGGNSTIADAEIMSLVNSIFNEIGLEKIKVQINAIGCEGCQNRYVRDVKEYFNKNLYDLCDTCKSRLERNPLRIFDCKDSRCKKVIKNAPLSVEYICKDCAEHFDLLKEYVYQFGMHIEVNPYLFRGLDYYTKAVFEFIDESSGEPLAICGGGRYDTLSKEIGGPKLASVGFGIGMERLISIMEKQKIKVPEAKPCEIYIIPLGGPAKLKAVQMLHKLRNAGIKTETDLVGRFIKPQMRYANKINAKYTLVIGAEEIDAGTAVVKNMSTGNETNINIENNFLQEFIDITRANENIREKGI